MYEQKVDNFIKIVDVSIPSLLFKQRCLGMQIDTQRTAVHIITSSPHLLVIYILTFSVLEAYFKKNFNTVEAI